MDTTQIRRIELTVHPLAVQLTDRPDPRNPNQALVSLQHWAAAALVFKAAGIAQLSESAVRDPEVSRLRSSIALAGDAALGREAAKVRVVLANDSELTAGVLHCRGSAGRPLSDEDLSEKTRAQLLTAFPADAVESILAACWRIAEYPQADAMCALLAASAEVKATGSRSHAA